MNTTTFQSQSCSFSCLSWKVLMRHTFEAHSNEHNFKFSCIFCSQTFTLYSSMMSHLSRKHRGELEGNYLHQSHQGLEEVEDDESDGGESSYMPFRDEMDHQPISPPPQPDHQRVCKAAALFLLTLKEKYKLTQTAINFSVSQVQQMVTYALEDMREHVQQNALDKFGAELPDVDKFTTSDPFEDLKTEHMQTKFLKDHFDLIVCFFTGIYKASLW